MELNADTNFGNIGASEAAPDGGPGGAGRRAEWAGPGEKAAAAAGDGPDGRPLARCSRRRFALAAAGTLASLVAGAPAAAAAAPGLLRAQGSRLTWRGRTVRLRGVAMGEPLARHGRTVEDYRTVARAWRANLVRLSVHPGRWRHQEAESLARLEQDVAAALANRMWVAIDWHVIGWPDGWHQRPGAGWGSPEDLYDSGFALAASFWRAMAERWGRDGRVIFELWNEPVRDPAQWNVAPGQNWPELKRLYRELLAVVRPRAQNLVLLGGDRWTYDLRGIRASPLEDPNAAYAWHVYASPFGNDPAGWARHLDGLDRVAPVVVTEWGFCPTCTGEHYQGTVTGFARPFLRKMLNGRSLSWTAWVWHPTWRPAMLEPDWTTPTEFGRFVQASLAQGSQPRP